jgi:hypothetical protein
VHMRKKLHEIAFEHSNGFVLVRHVVVSHRNQESNIHHGASPAKRTNLACSRKHSPTPASLPRNRNDHLGNGVGDDFASATATGPGSSESDESHNGLSHKKRNR